jgi:hypothetical protein
LSITLEIGARGELSVFILCPKPSADIEIGTKERKGRKMSKVFFREDPKSARNINKNRLVRLYQIARVISMKRQPISGR